MFLFWFKKILGALLLPMSLSLWACLAGLLLMTRAKHRRAGRALAALGVFLLYAASTPLVGNALVKPLERQYPMYRHDPERPLAFVAVLGGGNVPDPDLPPTAQIGGTAPARLAEGIRVWRMNPGARLVLSGGAVTDPTPNAEAMAKVARALGVPESAMILEKRPLDTETEARLLKETVGNRHFALVSEASHMPRAMALFRRQGLSPVPAPTAHMVPVRPGGGSVWRNFVPNSGGLAKTERAVYETLGMLWARLRGRA
jgi:uncharacterized SAM-binding protein YcdF (DUF218 family)